ncbi:MAG: acyltransferase, partial [Actinomycetota bacterium]
MPGTIVAPEDSDPARLDAADGQAAAGGLKFRRDIEGLRAVAVLMVVFSHLGFPGFASGFVGVDVFFVISGYLITSLLAKEYRRRAEASASGRGRISIVGFYRRRVLRILPAALTTIAVVLLAGKLLLNRIAFIKLQSEALWATFFGTNIQLIQQATDYFRVNVAQSPLQNFWSLAVEEQFYVVWPLVFLGVALIAGRRRDGSGWLVAVRAAVVVIGLASLAWSIRSAQIDPAAGYFSTFARAWQLALGAFIALTPAIAVRMKGKVASVSGLLGLGLLALALVVCGAEQGYPGWIALVPTGGAALLICAGLSETGRNPAGRLLSLRLPRAIGRISYSLYLWHWPLIIFAGVLYGKASTTAGARVGLLALSFVVATVSYFAIERPFIRLAHRPKESVGELPPVEEAEVGTARRDPADEDGPASGDGDGELSDAKRLEVERRRRIPKL